MTSKDLIILIIPEVSSHLQVQIIIRSSPNNPILPPFHWLSCQTTFTPQLEFCPVLAAGPKNDDVGQSVHPSVASEQNNLNNCWPDYYEICLLWLFLVPRGQLFMISFTPQSFHKCHLWLKYPFTV